MTSLYREHGAELGLGDRLVLFPDVDYIYPMFDCAGADEGHVVRDALAEADIESRLWYGTGVRPHPEFADAGSDELGTSGTLFGRLLGLPMAVDLHDREVRTILRVVSAASTRSATGAPVRGIGRPWLTP